MPNKPELDPIDPEEMEEISTGLFNSFNSLKELAKHHTPNVYEQWKAGGFIVDDNIVSMYPNAQDVIEALNDAW